MSPPDLVVAVRAALPSPRPQGWQALQQAAGLAEAGAGRVTLVGDAGRPEGGPEALAEWLGRPLPETLSVRVPVRVSRPPLAGLRFRWALRGLRGGVLLCRDPRVAAAQPDVWAAVLMEWHVAPDPMDPVHRRALNRADLHVTPAPGLQADLWAAGVPERRTLLLPNACGLDTSRAVQRAESRDPAGPVLALGLHRRAGLDDALQAWKRHADLPPLVIGGRDQGGVRHSEWASRLAAPGLAGRVTLLGPIWGLAREDLLDRCGVWLAPYPDDATTRTRLCPLQVVDALGSGLPVVAPKIPSVEVLGGNPVLYRPGDPDSLAAAVRAAKQSVTGHPSDRPRWADRGRQLLSAIGGRIWRAA
jgi:glycosyltransferase involved in cell wall biosynthesis